MDGALDNSISKAVHVLGCLRTLDGGASARELASVAGLPRSTTQRMLTTLAATGMVIQDAGSQKYRIGPRALLIGLGYNSGFTLVTEARPLMVDLRDVTGETVGLSVAVDTTRVFLEEVQSTAELRFASELGTVYPLWSGANGRVLMSALSASELNRLLASHDRETSVEHPLSPEDTMEKLDEFKRQGYAMAFNEAIADVNSVAAPVYGAAGLVAAMSVSGPAHRFTLEQMTAAVHPLQQACASLSERLGAPVSSAGMTGGWK